MKKGDVIINPYVPETFKDGSRNPMHKTMIIGITTDYVETLRYDGEKCKYYKSDVKSWKIEKHIDFSTLF